MGLLGGCWGVAVMMVMICRVKNNVIYVLQYKQKGISEPTNTPVPRSRPVEQERYRTDANYPPPHSTQARNL